MIPGNASAALIPNQPPDVAAFPPPDNNASTSTPIAIPIAVSIEAIVIPCSLNSVRIFSANEVLLSNTLAIVSLKLVIWDFSLPLRRLIDSCLTFKSPLRSSTRFVMSSRMPLLYSPGYSRILSSFRCFCDVFFQLNLFHYLNS